MKETDIEALTSKAILMVSANPQYQKKVMILCLFVCLETALANLINSTIFTNPLFRCAGVVTPESVACQNLQ